jgi:hypothetical protein
MEDSCPNTNAFAKQRKLLIGISLVLSFVEMSGVIVEKIRVFDNEIKITNPGSLKFVLWIALIYLLIRYLQYFCTIQDKGFCTSYVERRNKLLANVTVRKLRRDERVREASPAGKKQRYDLKAGELRLERISRTSAHGMITVGYTNREGEEWSVSHQITLDSHEMLLPRIRAFYQVQLYTPFFSEYILPFVVATIPAMIKIWLWISA